MLHGTQPPFFQEFDRARFVPSSACHTTATCRMALLKSQATATPICELWHHASDGRMRPIWCAAQRARRRLRTVQSEPVARELQRAISIPPACRRLAVLRHVSPLSSRSVTARHHRTGIFHFFLHHMSCIAVAAAATGCCRYPVTTIATTAVVIAAGMPSPSPLVISAFFAAASLASRQQRE